MANVIANRTYQAVYKNDQNFVAWTLFLVRTGRFPSSTLTIPATASKCTCDCYPKACFFITVFGFRHEIIIKDHQRLKVCTCFILQRSKQEAFNFQGIFIALTIYSNLLHDVTKGSMREGWFLLRCYRNLCYTLGANEIFLTSIDHGEVWIVRGNQRSNNSWSLLTLKALFLLLKRYLLSLSQ